MKVKIIPLLVALTSFCFVNMNALHLSNVIVAAIMGAFSYALMVELLPEKRF